MTRRAVFSALVGVASPVAAVPAADDVVTAVLVHGDRVHVEVSAMWAQCQPRIAYGGTAYVRRGALGARVIYVRAVDVERGVDTWI